MNSGKCAGNWVCTFFAVCLSHMNNAAGDPLLRHVHSNTEISIAFRWEVAQQAEAWRNVFILQRRSHVCVYGTSASALITRSSLDILIGFFYLSGTAFSSWDICFLLVLSFFFLWKCHPHTHSLVVNPAEDLLLCSEIVHSAQFLVFSREALTFSQTAPSGECSQIHRSSVHVCEQLN